MPKHKLTRQEKLHDNKGCSKVSVIEGKLSKRWGQGTVVIPAPLEVDGYMRQVPKGILTTINDIRVALAAKHGATIGCPITTGIFAWIAANAAEEQRIQGVTDITPHWRTLKVKGMINEKYPGGVEAQTTLLEQEGHSIIKRGKNAYVQNYQDMLHPLDQQG